MNNPEMITPKRNSSRLFFMTIQYDCFLLQIKEKLSEQKNTGPITCLDWTCSDKILFFRSRFESDPSETPLAQDLLGDCRTLSGLLRGPIGTLVHPV